MYGWLYRSTSIYLRLRLRQEKACGAFTIPLRRRDVWGLAQRTTVYDEGIRIAHSCDCVHDISV